MRELYEDWDKRWDTQVDSFFELSTALLPWRETDDTFTFSPDSEGIETILPKVPNLREDPSARELPPRSRGDCPCH